MHRTTKVTATLLFAAFAIEYVDRGVINLALPAIGDTFGLDHGQRGMIVSAFFITYALMQIPGGLLADKYGGMRMATLAVVLWSIATGLTAFAWSFGALLLIRAAFGAAQSLFPSAALAALTQRSTPADRMTANGWIQSSNAIGSLGAALLASLLLTVWDWRGLFLSVSFLGIIVFVLFRTKMPAPMSPDLTGSRPAEPGAGVRLLRSPVMWGFALMFFGYDVVIWGLNSWSSSYLVERHGVTIGQAGLYSIAPLIAAAVGAIIGGRLSDRYEGRPRRIVVPSMVVIAILLVVVAQVPTAMSYVLVLSVICLAAGLCYMPAFSVPLRSLPAAMTGAASAMILLGGQLSGLIVPTVFGFVVDHASYAAAFSMLVAGPVIAIAAVCAVPQTSRALLTRLGDLLPHERTAELDADTTV